MSDEETNTEQQEPKVHYEPAGTSIWNVEVDGLTLDCRYWPGPCNESTIRVRVPLADPEHVSGRDARAYEDGKTLPSRSRLDYPVNDDRDDPRNFSVYPGGDSHKSYADFEVSFNEESSSGQPSNSPFSLKDANLDKLCTTRTDRYGTFVIFRPEVAKAVVDSLQSILKSDRSPEALAKEALRRIPAGTKKENFLPFVRAAIQWLEAEQDKALRLDQTGRSFEIAGESLQYLDDFKRLAGRDFESRLDSVDWPEIEALPVTPKTESPTPPFEEQCLECGATYDAPGFVEDGGMGCDRCNSEPTAWPRHLIS